MTGPTNDQIIDSYAAWKIREGWSISYRTETGVQFTKPKQWNTVGIWAGLIFMPVFGIGLIFWIVVLIDYMSKSDTVIFVSIAEMETELKARRG